MNPSTPPLSTLPPPGPGALINQTVRLVGGCVAGIVVLFVVVYLLTV